MFITFEGMEGCGKSTQVNKLVEHFIRLGHDVLQTLEPGGSKLGQDLRRILLDPKNSDLASTSELFLYLADRAQHLATTIRPALENGRLIICDRFADSTIVYQGYGRGLDIKVLHQFNEVAVQGHWPDLTILLDVDPRVGLGRALNRNKRQQVADTQGRFEAEHLAFHTRVRDGYLSWATLNRKRFAVIDGSQDPDTVFSNILCVLEERGLV
ncbi:MAG: dTMP kinase [Desulfomicrobium sp.]|nr:dTMP kinase [Desulfomicrobium sp.]